MAIVIGNGAVPTMLGWFGDRGMFGWGFVLLGCLALAGVFLLRTLPAGQAEAESPDRGS
jgi:hypothetical protein